MSDTIRLPETNEEKIQYIVNALRKSVFEVFDCDKKKLQQEIPNYRDSEWKCETYWATYRRESCWNLSYCTYTYHKYRAVVMYKPFSLLNYPSDSFESKLIAQLYKECKDDTIARAVMETLLDEWRQKEDVADRQQRIESRSRYVKERLEETKEVAKNCGISVDMVLMIELSDVLYALQTGDEWFKSHVDYNAK